MEGHHNDKSCICSISSREGQRTGSQCCLQPPNEAHRKDKAALFLSIHSKRLRGSEYICYDKENPNVTLGKFSQWKSILKNSPEKTEFQSLQVFEMLEHGYELEQLDLTFLVDPVLGWGLNHIISRRPTEPKFLWFYHCRESVWVLKKSWELSPVQINRSRWCPSNIFSLSCQSVPWCTLVFQVKKGLYTHITN